MNPPPGHAAKFNFGPYTIVSQCALCVHLSTIGPILACTAFPGGIPDAIVINDFDHRRPYIDDEGRAADVGISGDQSLTFRPRPDAPPRALEQLYRALDRLPRVPT